MKISRWGVMVGMIMVVSQHPQRITEAQTLIEDDHFEADIISYQDWSSVLNEIVSDQGQVRYSLLFKSKTHRAFSRFLLLLEKPLPAKYSKKAEMSYWLNAYNALIIRHVLRFRGMESVATAVKNQPRYSFFKQKVHRVAGTLRSLDEIEHQILRSRFQDPRIHVALNCASISCPQLAREPFIARSLNRQLDDQARSFVNDSLRNQLSLTSLKLSKIFSWYGKDFQWSLGIATSDNRSIELSIKQFLCQYSDLSIEKIRDVNVQFLDYNWELNGKPVERIWPVLSQSDQDTD